MEFLGAYDRSTDLAAIHADVHFCWAFDRYNEGTNSDWCLLTRLYEAGVFGCVLLGQAGVATGDWLAARGVGVLLEKPYDASLQTWGGSLDPQSYAVSRRAMAEVPLSDFLDTDEDAVAFAERLLGRPDA
jgi:hypothetical protein